MFREHLDWDLPSLRYSMTLCMATSMLSIYCKPGPLLCTKAWTSSLAPVPSISVTSISETSLTPCPSVLKQRGLRMLCWQDTELWI